MRSAAACSSWCDTSESARAAARSWPITGTLGSSGARLARPKPWKRWLASSRSASARVRSPSSVNVMSTRHIWSAIQHLLALNWIACGTDAKRRAAMAGSGALAERVLGAPPAGERSDPDAAAALHGLFWFAANLASERPLLVLVDDLQWADAASLRWLVHLAPRLEGLPIALLLAARACDDELVDRLAADRAVRVLHPAELSEHAVAQMAAGALGEPPGAGFVRACRRATGGNPFLVGELLAELGR